MKKLNVTLAIALTTILFFMYACSNLTPEIEQPNLATQSFKYGDRTVLLKEGMLVFSSEADAAYFEQEAVANKQAILQWLAALPEFTSSEEAYHGLDENDYEAAGRSMAPFSDFAYMDEDGLVLPVVDDPAWKHLANSNGMFQVGDVTYKITREAAVGARSYALSANAADILSQATVRIPIKRNAAPPDVVEFRELVDECKAEYRPEGENRRRVRGQLRTQSSLFSSNVNCILETKHFKSTVGWWLFKATELRQTGCISVNGNSGLCFPANQTLNNEHSIEIVFFSGNNAFITPLEATAGVHFGSTVVTVNGINTVFSNQCTTLHF